MSKGVEHPERRAIETPNNMNGQILSVIRESVSLTKGTAASMMMV